MSDQADDRDGAEGSRKRARQACLNCRKKKVRCSGEKPVCSLCSRLVQTCRYEELADPGAFYPASPGSFANGHGAALSAEVITSKLESLQDRLSSMEAVLQSIVPLLSSLAKQPTMPLSDSTTPGSGGISGVSGPSVTAVGHQMMETHSAPATPSLPPTPTLQLAADLYFRFCYNQPYSLFHEATFRQRLVSGDLPDCLVWAMMASATRFSRLLHNEPVRYDEAVSYAKVAWDQTQLPWSPSSGDKDILPLLQTIILIVSSEHPAGHCSGAYMKLGFALRLALRARFHLEPDPSLPPEVREERRRVFWALYIQDKLISLSRENVPVLRDDQCRVNLPCSEAAFRAGIDEHTPSLEDLRGDFVDQTVISRCSPLAQCVVLAATLSRVTQYILLEERASKPIPPWSPSSPYAAIVSNLMQLESHFGMNEPIKQQLECTSITNGQVDQHIAGPLIYSRLLFHLCYSLLHHPFLLKQLIHRSQQKAPSSFLSRAWEIGRTHAICLSDLNRLRSENLVLLSSLYGYSTMIAGTIHVLSIHDQTPAVHEGAQVHYNNCIEFLRELSLFWKHAELMLARLQRFHRRSTEHSYLLDPKQEHTGQSATDLEVLWQSVDYAMLSIPTRPGTPVLEDVNRPGQSSTLQNSFFDFDFATWSEAPDMNWDFQDLNGHLAPFDASTQ